MLLLTMTINSYATPVAKPEITNIKYYSGSWHMAYNDVAVSTDLSVEKLFVDGVLDRQVNAGTTLASLKRGFRLLGTYDTTLCHKAYIVIYNKSNASVTQSNEFNFGDTSQCKCNGMSDTTNPVITLTGANPQSVVVGEAYSELGATALDNTDGDLTASINIDATAVDTTTLGEYSVTYSVIDAAGNDTLLNRTVKVVNASAVATSEIFAVKYYGGNWNIAYKDLSISPNLGVEKLFVDGTLDRQVNAGTSILSLRRGFRLLGTYDTTTCHTASLVIFNKAGDQIAKTADFNFGDTSTCPEDTMLTRDVPLVPANCKGHITQKGNDLNANGILDDNEVTSSEEFYDEGTPVTREEVYRRFTQGESLNVNTCKITDMSGLFNPASHGVLSLGGQEWFYGLSLNGIENWNTGRVTNMSKMFYGFPLTQNLNNWNVSNVTDMSNMFFSTYRDTFGTLSGFNQPLGDWNVSKVNNMDGMFREAAIFNQDISHWDIANVTSHTDFAKDSLLKDISNPFKEVTTASSEILAIKYYSGNWNIAYKDLPISPTLGVEKLFVDGILDRQVNAGTSIPSLRRGFRLLGTYDPTTCHTASLVIYDQSGIEVKKTADFNFGDTTKCVEMKLCDTNTAITREALRNMIINGEDVTQVNTCAITDMSRLFYNNTTFNQDISRWDVSHVTNMSGMFYFTRDFNQPIGNWDVSNVTNMSGMFEKTSFFNQSIGDWNVSHVTNMYGMFSFAASFNQPIEDWDVSSVTNMDSMFDNATSFNQPIGDWDVSSVLNMSSMFYSTTSFNQPIGGWDVSSVTNMNGMFLYTTAFNQALNTWNVSNVTEHDAFNHESALTTQNLPNFP